MKKLFTLAFAAAIAATTFTACDEGGKETPEYKVTMADSQYATVGVKSAEDEKSYSQISATEGETVTIDAAEIDENYTFTGWTVVKGGVTLSPDAKANPATFKMPAREVEIKAEFAERQVMLPAPSEGEKTAFADEPEKTVTFTAKSDWTASVAEATRASGVSWLRLMLDGEEIYGGKAGTFDLTIELDINYSGADRSAVIAITSGGTTVTIDVTQKGVTESGEEPEDPEQPEKPEEPEQPEQPEQPVEPETVAVIGVSLNKSATTLTVGDTETLTATVAPANATNKKVTWSSDKPDIATVDNGTATDVAPGMVKALAPGKATITVITDDGRKITACTVTVESVTVAVTGITIAPEGAVTVAPGGSVQLTATVKPDNATNRDVTWSVDPGQAMLASVDATGRVTVGNSTNSFTVTVTAMSSADHSIKTEKTITVGTPEPEYNEFTYAGTTHEITIGKMYYYGDYYKTGNSENVWLGLYSTDGTGAEISMLVPKGTDRLAYGTYTGAGSHARFTFVIDDEDSSVKVDGTADEWVNITGGTVNVSIEGETYTIEVDCTLADGSKLTGTYRGEPEWVDEIGDPEPEAMLINGVEWAAYNVGEPNQFVGEESAVGSLYQFGKNNTTWTPPTIHYAADFWDMENANPCPSGYVVPTEAQIKSLVDATKVTYEYAKESGVQGGRFTDKDDPTQSIFLPSTGYNQIGTVGDVGSGHYWSSGNADVAAIDAASYLNFHSAGASLQAGQYNTAHIARAIRCVRAEYKEDGIRS